MTEVNKSPSVAKPIPSITRDMVEFFEGARRGQLMVQKCEGCGELRFHRMRYAPDAWDPLRMGGCKRARRSV